MRTLVLVVAVIAIGACAEFETSQALGGGVDQGSTMTTGQAVFLTADDGTVFEVSVVHDGSITPVEELTLIESIGVIGIRPVDSDLTPAGGGGFVPPADPNLVPNDDTPVNIWITGVDGETLLGHYRWDWLDDIDEEEIEAFIEDICPPWH